MIINLIRIESIDRHGHREAEVEDKGGKRLSQEGDSIQGHNNTDKGPGLVCERGRRDGIKSSQWYKRGCGYRGKGFHIR